MASHNDKSKIQEDKFAHKAEVEFKILCRANMLFGLWAAEQMELGHDEAYEYALTVVDNDIDEHSVDAVIEKIAEDFKENCVRIPHPEIRQEYFSIQELARDESISK
jgi:hypothetical protein